MESFNEAKLGIDKFSIEDIRLLLGMVGILQSRLEVPCYKQDFTISHILEKTAKNLLGATEMMALRIMADLQSE